MRGVDLLEIAALRERVRELEAQAAAMRGALEGLMYSDGHFRGECSAFRCHPTCEKARKALSEDAGRDLLEQVEKLEEENARLQKENAGLKEYVRELQEEIQDFIDRG